jgi:catechol 2,3-dioxygenase-like lactoylglutathione lyase family enzyme
MLANAPVYVSLPTTDLPRARHFYETVLGLPVQAVGGPEPGNPDLRGRVVYRAGAGTLLSIYERPVSPAEHTAAFFVVDDFDQTLVELRSRGLAWWTTTSRTSRRRKVCWLRRMPGGGPGSTTPTATCSACSSSRSSPPRSANQPRARAPMQGSHGRDVTHSAFASA